MVRKSLLAALAAAIALAASQVDADALVAWAKADIAVWHASTTFNLLGWVVDKGSVMLTLVGAVVLVVVCFFVGVGLLDPDKADEPRHRPGSVD